MKFVIQRVTRGSVSILSKETGEWYDKDSIEKGFVVLVGIAQEDTKEIADKMISKLIGLRIFEDSEGKTNLNLESVGGELLLVSQFTLYADCKHGNRPGFTGAGKPDIASPLFDYIVEECRKRVKNVGCGVFGADMRIDMVNDGPFTIILDSDELK